MTTPAVIFVPADADHIELYISQCIAHCITVGYDHDAGVVGDWHAALAMVADGQAVVIVVARHDHLPPDGVPRIEVAAERTTTPVQASDKHRNTARLRRPHRL